MFSEGGTLKVEVDREQHRECSRLDPRRPGAVRRGRGGLMQLTTAQTDRACGVILGSAVGDALGAGYEFGCAAVGPDGPAMIGGGLGNFAPGGVDR